MNSRNLRIITQVRLHLGEIATDKIGHKNGEIYEKANYIQDEILRETKCKDIEFTIYTIDGVEEYDLNIENQNMIKLLETSWGGTLSYFNPTNWDELAKTGGGYPAFYTLFDRKLRLRVNPNNDDDEIKIWAYQENVIIPMDDDIEPEIPSYADRCLIFGICAEYDPKGFYELYEDAKSKVAINAHNKVSYAKNNNSCNW